MPKMEIDIQRFYTEGHTYVMSVIEQLKDEAWQELVKARLSQASPEELEILKNLWSYGYVKGAEAALSFVTELRKETI